MNDASMTKSINKASEHSVSVVIGKEIHYVKPKDIKVTKDLTLGSFLNNHNELEKAFIKLKEDNKATLEKIDALVKGLTTKVEENNLHVEKLQTVIEDTIRGFVTK